MPPIKVFAPAKINLALHVTGLRGDGYHLLDSLVMFADVGDWVTLAPAGEMGISVSGPKAQGVPEDARNLCCKAAEFFGERVQIGLEKHLPNAAGIGGGSSDAAAVLKGMAQVFDRPFDGDAATLGADVPVCLYGQSCRMSGVGEAIHPVSAPVLHVVLANPGVDVPTPAVFRALGRKDNAPMSQMPNGQSYADWIAWFKAQRNDLQAPAITLAPEIETSLNALEAPGIADLVRMSGSGATCFALCPSAEAALDLSAAYRAAAPDHWVTAGQLS